MDNIHCKVLYGNEFRRFALKNADFSTLFDTVKRLFSLPYGSVLKYRDDEGDLVTISSTEELSCALEFSSGLLHLVVVTPTLPPVETPERCWGDRPYDCRKRKGCKREKKWGKWEKRGKCPMRNPEFIQKKIDCLTKKREFLQLRLNSLQNQSVDNTPDLLKEQKYLESKLLSITSCLEKFSLRKDSIPKDAEILQDAVVPLTDTDKEKLLAELKEIQEFRFLNCKKLVKESRTTMKLLRNQLQCVVDEESKKSLFAEWELANQYFRENKQILFSVIQREKEISSLLGIERKEWKKHWKGERKREKSCEKDCKRQNNL